MLLKDKVALITGASSGIGRATVSLFAEQGAKVIVVDINDARGVETVREIEKKGGEGPLSTHRCWRYGPSRSDGNACD